MTIDEWQRLQPACFVRLGTCTRKWTRRIGLNLLFPRRVFPVARFDPEALFYYGRAADGGDPHVRRVALVEKARLGLATPELFINKG